MVVRSKRYGHPGCSKAPSHGVEGTKQAELCAQHAREGMVDVEGNKCGIQAAPPGLHTVWRAR